MAFLSSMDICASGMTAQRLRLDVAAENITNRDTTRTENGGPYRKKSVVFQSIPGPSFQNVLSSTMRRQGARGGVEVAEIVEDQGPLNLVYNPGHPDADADGYVSMPNVDSLEETTDAMSASRSYEANITVLNTIKQMAAKALEIGK